MRLSLTSCALLTFAVCAMAQAASPAPQAPTPSAAEQADLAAATTRLGAALQKCASATDTAFAFRWGPDKKKKADDPFARMMGEMASGATKGSWHGHLTHVVFENDSDDELLVADRRVLAKDGTVDWQVRRGRFADGNPAAFVPDVPALLRQLAAWELPVTHRAVGALDDRPVEVLSVTLSAEQVADAVWGGLLPEAIATPASAGRVFRVAMGGGGGRQPMTPPEATIDLAIHLDPATNVVHKLHFRGWATEPKGGAGGVVMVAAGGRVAVNNADDDEEEEADEKAAPKKDAPLVYENGLPVRPRKKTSVCDVTLTLSEHGQKQPPALDDTAKKLLGR